MKPIQITCALALGLSASLTYASEPCANNFTASGNLLTGKTYKTIASIPNISPQEAFDGALQYTSGNGFLVLSSNKQGGTISAVQAANHRTGKNVPLTIVLVAEGANTSIGMSYLTPLGVLSPEEAIKNHFCNTVKAAANSAKAPIAVTASTSPNRPILRGYAAIKPEQKTKILAELLKNIPDEIFGERVSLAKDSILNFVERVGCLTDAQGIDALMAGTGALNEFAAPNINFTNNAVTSRPMRGMSYNDKKLCISVNRIHDWKSPANNALSFEVVFKADDSGEIQKRRFETIKQTDGTWLFGYFY